jgi:hypothetical protein
MARAAHFTYADYVHRRPLLVSVVWIVREIVGWTILHPRCPCCEMQLRIVVSRATLYHHRAGLEVLKVYLPSAFTGTLAQTLDTKDVCHHPMSTKADSSKCLISQNFSSTMTKCILRSSPSFFSFRCSYKHATLVRTCQFRVPSQKK